MNLISMLERIKDELPEGQAVDFITASHGKAYTALRGGEDIVFTSDNGNEITVKWPEFQQVLHLLKCNPQGVLAGNAQNSDDGVGKGNCGLTTIEGQISHYVYGIHIGGNPKTRRATYIMPILIKADLVKKDSTLFKLK